LPPDVSDRRMLARRRPFAWREGAARLPPVLLSAPPGGLLVDAGAEHSPGGDLRQLRVRSTLLVERLVEEIAHVAHPELVCERAGGAVAGDLVVLDPLCLGDEGSVEGDGV